MQFCEVHGVEVGFVSSQPELAAHNFQLLPERNRQPHFRASFRASLPQHSGVYCAQVRNSLQGMKFTMVLKAVEEVPAEVPVDDFQALEEKVYRTIELYKAAREAKAAAERDVQRLRQQLEEREEEVESLRREAVQLRKDREEVRGRVEKMLRQIDSIGEQVAS